MGRGVWHLLLRLRPAALQVLHKGHISGRDTEIAFGKISAESLRSSQGTDVRVSLSGTGVGPGSGLLTMNAIFEMDQVRSFGLYTSCTRWTSCLPAYDSMMQV